jgi:hypothetical protein
MEIKRYAWIGPEKVTANSLELNAIVTEFHRGNFHTGIRYGAKGGALPELALKISGAWRRTEERTKRSSPPNPMPRRRCGDVKARENGGADGKGDDAGEGSEKGVAEPLRLIDR